MNTKTLKSAVLLSVLSIASCSTLFADPVPNPTALPPQATTAPTTTTTNTLSSAPGFFSSVRGYFTAFDTNSTTFQTAKTSAWLGADFQNGINADMSLGLDYKIWGPIELENVARVFQSDNTLKSEQLGAGVGFVIYDVKLAGYIEGGYDFQGKRAFLGLAAQAEKALTDHTFAGVRLETDISNGKQIGWVGLLVGATF